MASIAAPAPFSAAKTLPRALVFLLFLWFSLSGVTLTAGEQGTGIAGRLALPDIALLIAFPLAMIFAIRREGLMMPRMAYAMVVLLLWFCIGIPFSTQPFETMFECLVHIYAFLGFVAVYAVMRSLSFEGRLVMQRWWALASMVVAAMGFYDLFSPFLHMPGLGDIGGDFTGTFRNAGQAGQFYLMSASAVYPYFRIAKGKHKWIATVALAVVVLACVLTIKRSALMGLAMGMFMAVILERDWARMMRSLLITALIGAIGTVIWVGASSVSEVFASRIDRKTGEGAADRMESFLEENFAVADEATKRNLLTGAGIGGVAGYYGTYEIHSGYFGIFVNSGVGGFTIYLWFLWEYFVALRKPRNNVEDSKDFSRIALAMAIGMAVGWVYTLQLRKREFWITSALVLGQLAPLPAGKRHALSRSRADKADLDP